VRRMLELHHVHWWNSAVRLIHRTTEWTAEYDATLCSVNLVCSRGVRVVPVLLSNNDWATQWTALSVLRSLVVGLRLGLGLGVRTDDDGLAIDVLHVTVDRWISSYCRDSLCYFHFLVAVSAMEEFVILVVVVVLLVLLILLTVVDLVLHAVLHFVASDVTNHVTHTVAH